MNILLIFLIFLAIFFHFCETFPQDIHNFIEKNAYLCTIDDENVRFLLEKEAKDALCNEICGQDEIKACAKNVKNDEIFCQDVSEACLREFKLEFNTDFHTTQFPELPTAMGLVQTTNLPFNEEQAVSALTGLNSHYPAPQPPEISVNQTNSHQNGVFENSTSSSLQNIDNSDQTITTPEMIEPAKIIFPSLGNLSGGEDASEKSNFYSARPINFKDVDESLGITPQPEQTTESFQSDPLQPAPPSATPPENITANFPLEPYITTIAPNLLTLPEAYPSNSIQTFPIPPTIIDYNQPQIQTMLSEYTQEMSGQTKTFLYTATTTPYIHPTDEITPVSGYKIPEIRISFENLPHELSKSAPNYENGYPTTLPMTKNFEEAITPVPPRELYPRNFNIGLWINPIFGEIPEEEMHYLSRSKRPEFYRPRENVRPYETSGEKYENLKKLEEISGETNSVISYDKNSHKQPASAEKYEEKESPTNYEKYPSAEKYEVSQRPKNFGRQPDGPEEGRSQNHPYHRYPGYRFFPYRLYKPYGPYLPWERPRWYLGDSVRDYLRRKELKKEKTNEGSKNLENTEEKRNRSSKEVSQKEKSCQDLNYMCPLVVLSNECDLKIQEMCTKRCDMCKEKPDFS